MGSYSYFSKKFIQLTTKETLTCDSNPKLNAPKSVCSNQKEQYLLNTVGGKVHFNVGSNASLTVQFEKNQNTW